MSIWFKEVSLQEVNDFSRGNLGDHLGIEFIDMGDDYLCARMPVLPRVHQPFGVLHGGASVALAETVGSMAANLCVDMTRRSCVGQEINANHLRPVAKGYVIGTARPVHRGKTSQVWEIRMEDDRGRLVCISRLTMAVIERPGVRVA